MHVVYDKIIHYIYICMPSQYISFFVPIRFGRRRGVWPSAGAGGVNPLKARMH